MSTASTLETSSSRPAKVKSLSEVSTQDAESGTLSIPVGFMAFPEQTSELSDDDFLRVVHAFSGQLPPVKIEGVAGAIGQIAKCYSEVKSLSDDELAGLSSDTRESAKTSWSRYNPWREWRAAHTDKLNQSLFRTSQAFRGAREQILRLSHYFSDGGERLHINTIKKSHSMISHALLQALSVVKSVQADKDAEKLYFGVVSLRITPHLELLPLFAISDGSRPLEALESGDIGGNLVPEKLAIMEGLTHAVDDILKTSDAPWQSLYHHPSP